MFQCRVVHRIHQLSINVAVRIGGASLQSGPWVEKYLLVNGVEGECDRSLWSSDFTSPQGFQRARAG
jgi:hypothetical protein